MVFEWIKKNGANWVMMIANTKRTGEVISRVHYCGYDTWVYYIKIPGVIRHFTYIGKEFPFKAVQDSVREIILEQLDELALREAELEEMLVD